jgi:hypothetical protein
VAAGHERAHPQFLGEGEGLALGGFGLLDLWWITMWGNITEEAQGIRLTTSRLVGTAIFESTGGERVCLLQAARLARRSPPQGAHALLQKERVALRCTVKPWVRRTSPA